MDFCAFALRVLMILYTINLYYVFFIHKSQPYRISEDKKQRIENFYLVMCWWATNIWRNDEDGWVLIGMYILILQHIPIYNKLWCYPNFGRRDCFLTVSIQAAMFLTRGYTHAHAHTICLALGFVLQVLKNRVFYSPDDELVKEKLLRRDKV